MIVTGVGTTQISGKFAASPNNVTGGLNKDGPGTLILKNPANTIRGGTFVNAGTLAIGATGTVIPAGQPVTVEAGAIFDYGPYTNTGGNASAP